LPALDIVHKPFGIRVTQDEPVPWWSGKKVSSFLIWAMIGADLVLSALFVAYGSKEFLMW
jgi:hypothetical protein